MHEHMMKRKTSGRKKRKPGKKEITNPSLQPEGLGLVRPNRRVSLSLTLRESKEEWSWIQNSLQVGK